MDEHDDLDDHLLVDGSLAASLGDLLDEVAI